MAAALTPTTARDGAALLATLLADHPERVRDLALATLRLIGRVAPDASQLFYRSYAISVACSYSARLGEAFCHVAVYKNHVNLGFNRGVHLHDPAGLLQGTGKLIRHVRLTTDRLDEQPLYRLLEQSEQQGLEMALSKNRVSPPTIVAPRGTQRRK